VGQGGAGITKSHEYGPTRNDSTALRVTVCLKERKQKMNEGDRAQKGGMKKQRPTVRKRFEYLVQRPIDTG
jgi:hypothetical protein